ncbi:MAG: redoxin domain-containing protein [Candidatus Hydrogenedentes bacterium]|nr:redoxin domain-containing protein [Candidatus Hydrogenedentota bacterium]
MKWILRNRFTLEIAALVALNAAVPFAAIASTTDFTLKEAGGGKTFSLADAKGKYVALHFLLKTECPICLRHTQTYASKTTAFPNVVQVFIKPDSDEATIEWAKKLSPEERAKAPTIYRDPDAKLADEFNIPNGYAFHGETVHYPALVLLGPDGKEVFRYVGKGTMDRFPFEKFAEKMAELTRPAAAGQYNLGSGGLALQGYDPVSYFSGKPAPGKKDIATSHAGVTYYFADAKNRDAFLAAPRKYLPAYGGWCATAMALGKKVEISPENYKITDGRLFLFYKNFISNAISDWNKDEPKNIAAADKYWHEFSGE